MYDFFFREMFDFKMFLFNNFELDAVEDFGWYCKVGTYDMF